MGLGQLGYIDFAKFTKISLIIVCDFDLLISTINTLTYKLAKFLVHILIYLLFFISPFLVSIYVQYLFDVVRNQTLNKKNIGYRKSKEVHEKNMPHECALNFDQ